MVKFNYLKIILFWPLQYFLSRSATANGRFTVAPAHLLL